MRGLPFGLKLDAILVSYIASLLQNMLKSLADIRISSSTRELLALVPDEQPSLVL